MTPDKDLKAKAQYLLHLIAGEEIPPGEYSQKFDLVYDQLLVVYSIGYKNGKEEDIFRKDTVRPYQPIEDFSEKE